MKSYLLSLRYVVLLMLLGVAWADPVVHGWNNRSVLPISELAMLKGQEFPQLNFDPPLNVRKDGSLFLSVTLVDSDIWINMALNSFVSLAKYHNMSGLTIMTMNDKRLGSVFEKLGLFTYDANSTIATFPEDFRLEKPLPSWSWGAIIFLRFNAWFEAFRRGIGFCSIDTDVTYGRDVFFVKKADGQYVDITTQGQTEPVDRKMKNVCLYKWTQQFNNRVGYYINPGLACHAYSERMLKFMQELQPRIAWSIQEQQNAWGQPAYHMTFCKNDFAYLTPNPEKERWHWDGVLKKHNLSVSIFAAPAPPGAKHAEQDAIKPAHRPHIHAYHAKSCHGADRGDAVARVKCKEDWLKEQGQWFLPEGLPRGLDAWLSINETTVATLKALLHPMN